MDSRSATPLDENEAWDLHRETPMFGDTFQSRGDYTKGTFYGYRRAYLDKEHLRPPDLLMTKKQVVLAYFSYNRSFLLNWLSKHRLREFRS